MSKTKNRFSPEVRERGTDGWRAPGRLWRGMGGDCFCRVEVGLHGRNAALAGDERA